MVDINDHLYVPDIPYDVLLPDTRQLHLVEGSFLYHNSNERLIGDSREISRELTSRDTYPNLLVEVALGIIQRLLELCFDFAELAAGAVQFLNLVL